MHIFIISHLLPFIIISTVETFLVMKETDMSSVEMTSVRMQPSKAQGTRISASHFEGGVPRFITKLTLR